MRVFVYSSDGAGRPSNPAVVVSSPGGLGTAHADGERDTPRVDIDSTVAGLLVRAGNGGTMSEAGLHVSTRPDPSPGVDA